MAVWEIETLRLHSRHPETRGPYAILVDGRNEATLRWRRTYCPHIVETIAGQSLPACIHCDQFAGNPIYFNVGAESSSHDPRAISRTYLDNAARFPMPHHAIRDFCIARFEVAVSI